MIHARIASISYGKVAEHSQHFENKKMLSWKQPSVKMAQSSGDLDHGIVILKCAKYDVHSEGELQVSPVIRYIDDITVKLISAAWIFTRAGTADLCWLRGSGVFVVDLSGNVVIVHRFIWEVWNRISVVSHTKMIKSFAIIVSSKRSIADSGLPCSNDAVRSHALRLGQVNAAES